MTSKMARGEKPRWEEKSSVWFCTWNNPPFFTTQNQIDWPSALLMAKHLTNFQIQLERGKKTGTIHIQGHLKFSKKLSRRDVADLFPGIWVDISKWREANLAYTKKEETRLAGPWDRKTLGEDIVKYRSAVKGLNPNYVCDMCGLWVRNSGDSHSSIRQTKPLD